MLQEELESYDQLQVWQLAHRLVLDVYTATSTFPQEEKYGLTSQMRRAGVSIPANIAEGFKRRGMKDKIHFYNIAQSSLSELSYYLVLARDLRYSDDLEGMTKKARSVSRMLTALSKSIRTAHAGRRT